MSLSVGERLKSAREAKKISLDEACRLTKIQRRTLEAIEQGRVKEVLDPVYAKIFVKKYAAFLGIDGSALFEEMAPESSVMVVSTQRPAPQFQRPTPQPRRSSPNLTQLLAPAGIVLAALIGVGFLGYVTMDLVHTLSRQRQAPPATHAVPSVAIERKAEEPEFLVSPSKPLKLTAQTTADVWLQVKSDGAVIFQNVLARGSRETWTAKKEIELWTGNAGAMRLSLNGKELEGLGRGVKKGVRITHAGLRSQ